MTATEIKYRLEEAERKMRPIRENFVLELNRSISLLYLSLFQQEIDEEGCGAFFAAYKEQHLWPE